MLSLALSSDEKCSFSDSLRVEFRVWLFEKRFQGEDVVVRTVEESWEEGELPKNKMRSLGVVGCSLEKESGADSF